MSSNRVATPSQPVDALSRTLSRTELQRSRSSIPGREIVQVLTEIQAGAESGWHMHPGEEVGYIVAGTVQITVDGQPTLTLRAGDPFLVPPRTPHNALDVGPATGQVLSTYIVDRWEPLAWFTRGTARPPARDTNREVRGGAARTTDQVHRNGEHA